MGRRLLALWIVAASLAGCNLVQKGVTVSGPALTSAPPNPWTAVSTDPQNPSPALLWNGAWGIRIGRNGGGSGLPAFRADNYQTSGKENLVQLPSPLPNGPPFDENRVTGYRQILDFHSGILTTRFSMDGTETEIVEAMNPDVLDVDKPIGMVWGRSEVVESAMAKSVGKAAEGDLHEFPDPGAGQSARGLAILAASRAYWRNIWSTDIEIDGPVADQQAVHSELFYLRSLISSSRIGPTKPSNRSVRESIRVAPFGLSNLLYGGHVFWDADVWVMPTMAFIDPESARWIEAYRLSLLKAYEHNGVVQVPWESSVSGLELAPPHLRLEIHGTGSTAWALRDAEAMGLMDDQAPTRPDHWKGMRGMIQRFVRGAANYYLTRSTLRPDGKRELTDVVSPNEWAEADNDLYTNLVAQLAINDETWSTKNGSFVLPHDGNSFLTYDHDPLRVYKQATAQLAIYPLQYPAAEAQANAIMNRYVPRTSKLGPAMTDPIDAIIWARMGDRDLAYKAWEQSWKDFQKPPLMQFGEYRITNRTYFVTGAAGSLQAVIYGFLGFRVDNARNPRAAWSTPLEDGKWLNVSPHLPKQWKSVRFKGFMVLGKRYTMTATPTGVKVVPGE